MRQGTGTDIGVDPLQMSIRFDYTTMTVTGCKCNSCWVWKTEPDQRKFWRMKAAA